MKELLAAVLNETEDGTLSVTCHMDDHDQLTGRLDQLLIALMQARAGMQPAVSQEPLRPGQNVQPIVGAPWRVDPTMAGDLLLSFHHPALGWLTWHMPPASGQEISDVLVRVLAQEAQPPKQFQ